MTGISIVIPVFNRENLIGQTLKSLLHQTVPADEIVVVDDGSTDNTAKIAESFGSPIRVVKQRNQGPAAARNFGAKQSTGEFLHFFDSDDLALPNKHQLQLAALQTSGTDIAMGPWIKGRIFENSFEPQDQVLQQEGLPREPLSKSILTDWSIIPHACLFRRSIFEKVGGFPEELTVAEDQLMFLRCLLAGATVIHTPETLTLYRIGNDENKLTGSPEGESMRRREWSKFLCAARNDCLSHGFDPAEWFKFRYRAWVAAHDLKAISSEDHDLLEQLSSIYGENMSDFTFCLYRIYQQNKGGLQYRITSARGSRSFRMGRLSMAQKHGINQVFLNNT